MFGRPNQPGDWKSRPAQVGVEVRQILHYIVDRCSLDGRV
jgi:hypothetical protein